MLYQERGTSQMIPIKRKEQGGDSGEAKSRPRIKKSGTKENKLAMKRKESDLTIQSVRRHRISGTQRLTTSLFKRRKKPSLRTYRCRVIVNFYRTSKRDGLRYSVRKRKGLYKVRQSDPGELLGCQSVGRNGVGERSARAGRSTLGANSRVRKVRLGREIERRKK